MMKKIVSYYPYAGTTLDDFVFKNKNSWEYHLKQDLQKENVEIHTYDKLSVEKADYFLVFDNMFYRNLDIMWDLYNNKKLDNSVYINYEPITGHAKNHDETGMKHLANIFSKIITFDDDIIDGKKFIKGNVANFFSEELEYKNNFSKRKFLVMITNNTNINSIIQIMNVYNGTDYYNKRNVKTDEHSIYSERERAVKYFMKKCPDKFSLYGALWDEKKYKRILNGPITREDKLNKLNEYNFCICYDSYTNQNGYISEKIFDAFKAKCVPVYMGANNVYDYIPEGCFIDKRKFKNYDELYNFLLNMNEKDYNKYIENINKYLNSKEFKDNFSSEAIGKIICSSFKKENKIDYKKAYESLMYFENKKNELHKENKVYYSISKLEESKISIKFNLKTKNHITLHTNGLNNENEKIDFKESFTINETFNYLNKNLYIKFYDNDLNKYLDFIPIDKELDKELGLIVNKKKELRYLDYLRMGKKSKLLYLIKHNKKKLIKRLFS